MVDATKKTPATRGGTIPTAVWRSADPRLGAVLPSSVLRTLVEEEVGAVRERIYPPLTTLGLFIGQALSPDGACQDAVARRLSERTARVRRRAA